MEKILKVTLTEEDVAATAGGLVNLVLRDCFHLTGHEISHAKFTEQGITVRGERVTVKNRLQAGDTLVVRLSEEDGAGEGLISSHGALDILYEDEDILILNKPAGRVCHPSHGHYSDSIANDIVGYYEAKEQTVVCRVIGRLDKETSGVVLYALNRVSAARLQAQRTKGEMVRTYVAIAEGHFAEKEGIITKPLGKVSGELMKQCVYLEGDPRGHAAITRYRVLAENENSSLLQVTIDTGRTHQIRVHMADAGHPLLGDTLYGNPDGRFRRAALHAQSLRLHQPFTGEPMLIKAPFPCEFKEVFPSDLSSF